MVIIQDLFDDAKCYQTIREMRWRDGVNCPRCSSDSVIKNGRDDTEPHRQRYECQGCHLGRYGSPESVAEYNRLIQEWLSQEAQSAPVPGPAESNPTVSELILAFWTRFATPHYRRSDGTPTGELENSKDSLRPLRKLYGHTTARDFGPLALKAVRQSMIDSGLARSTINQRVGRIVWMFKWAVENEMLPPVVHQALADREDAEIVELVVQDAEGQGRCSLSPGRPPGASGCGWRPGRARPSRAARRIRIRRPRYSQALSTRWRKAGSPVGSEGHCSTTFPPALPSPQSRPRSPCSTPTAHGSTPPLLSTSLGDTPGLLL